MKLLIKNHGHLIDAGRCDIDFHLPPEHLEQYPSDLITTVSAVAETVKDKRDPGDEPEVLFRYVDISSIDVAVGRIVNSQELHGSEAPSRARKIIRSEYIIVSTCRPTRGAIAVVPEHLDDEICSTAFSVLDVREDKILPNYLHWALRLPSTLEQFRKWSTGSSYPAILDEDVAKTRIPVPTMEVQDRIVECLSSGLRTLDQEIERANRRWFDVRRYAEALVVDGEPTSQN